MRFLTAALLLFTAMQLFTVDTARAGEPTRVTVRVLAHDAKLIGDVAGGSRVTIRERDSGRILADGIHYGSTGSTDKIINNPRQRDEARFDTDNAAGFQATLDLVGPTWITVEARGPLGFPQATTTTSRTLLVLPGRHIEGDGIVMIIQGLVVSLLTPDSEAKLAPGTSVAIEAGVKLMCTCPIFEGSHWEAADYAVVAEIWARDKMIAQAPLTITDRHNVFGGEIELPTVAAGETLVAELRVLAENANTGNHGYDQAVFRIQGPQLEEEK